MQKKTVYLAGKITGAPFYRSKFYEAQKKLEEGGFEWSYSHSWAKQNRDQFEAFWRFQDGSDALWDWLSAHVAAEIGAHNLLKIWG